MGGKEALGGIWRLPELWHEKLHGPTPQWKTHSWWKIKIKNNHLKSLSYPKGIQQRNKFLLNLNKNSKNLWYLSHNPLPLPLLVAPEKGRIEAILQVGTSKNQGSLFTQLPA